MAIEGIELTQADGRLYVRGQPHPGRAPLDEPALVVLLEEGGFAEWQQDADGMARAVLEANTRDIPFLVEVASRCDSRIEVAVADDGMQATLSLAPPRGGKRAGIEEAVAALMEAGVSFGLDQAALLAACEAGMAENCVVASGAAPLEGHDSDFVELLPDASDRAPRVDEQGLIDYREHAGLSLVEPGAPLMRRVPAVPGVPGQTVRGQPIAPRPVRDEPFAENLSGACISADDPELLTAAIGGAPVRVPRGVTVEPVLRVAEVNLGSGNIQFDGTVEVQGDVIQEMKVQASGDIFVGGTVEGAVLHAGGNVNVKGGIVAGSRVQAGGAIAARFAEGSSLEAGTVIALADAALDANLTALNQIQIGARNPQRGRLVGGVARAKMQLQVPVLGSDKSGTTKVVLGHDPALEAEFQQLEARIAQEKANEENLQKLCKHLVAIKDPKGMLERAKGAWRQATQAWGKSLVERTELEKRRNALLQARLSVTVQTQGSIELSLGARRALLRKEYGRGSFGIARDAGIAYTGPDGKAYPV